MIICLALLNILRTASTAFLFFFHGSAGLQVWQACLLAVVAGILQATPFLLLRSLLAQVSAIAPRVNAASVASRIVINRSNRLFGLCDRLLGLIDHPPHRLDRLAGIFAILFDPSISRIYPPTISPQSILLPPFLQPVPIPGIC